MPRNPDTNIYAANENRREIIFETIRRFIGYAYIAENDENRALFISGIPERLLTGYIIDVFGEFAHEPRRYNHTLNQEFITEAEAKAIQQSIILFFDEKTFPEGINRDVYDRLRGAKPFKYVDRYGAVVEFHSRAMPLYESEKLPRFLFDANDIEFVRSVTMIDVQKRMKTDFRYANQILTYIRTGVEEYEARGLDIPAIVNFDTHRHIDKMAR